MAKIAIVQKSDDKIVTWYEADAPNQKAYGGPWGRPEESAHVQLSESLDADCVKPVWVEESTDEEGNITPAHYELQEDADLVAAKTQKVRDQKLAQMRKLREPMLKKADANIQMHQDSDPNAVATEADWRTYRTELRNVTADYKYASDDDKGKAALDAYAEDMSDFDGWPTKPS